MEDVAQVEQLDRFIEVRQRRLCRDSLIGTHPLVELLGNLGYQRVVQILRRCNHIHIVILRLRIASTPSDGVVWNKLWV